MPAHYKPEKYKDQKKRTRRRIFAFRDANRLIAINRDENKCTFCWFIDGVVTPATEVHHVYSRESRVPFSFREHYHSLLCTCREHHPMAIQTRPAPNKLQYVVDVLNQANATPINKNFEHSTPYPPEENNGI